VPASTWKKLHPLDKDKRRGYQKRGPLRLRESPQIRAAAIAAQELEDETSCAIRDEIEHKGLALVTSAQQENHAADDQARDHHGFDDLNREKPHADKIWREPGASVFLLVLRSPSAGAAMTTTDQQTSNSAAGQKSANTESLDVEISEYRLMGHLKEERSQHEHRNFLVIVDEEFLTRDDLCDHGESEEGGNGDGRDAKKSELRKTDEIHEQNGLRQSERKPGIAADLEARRSPPSQRYAGPQEIKNDAADVPPR
jgi:hypothetical protein